MALDYRDRLPHTGSQYQSAAAADILGDADQKYPFHFRDCNVDLLSVHPGAVQSNSACDARRILLCGGP